MIFSGTYQLAAEKQDNRRKLLNSHETLEVKNVKHRSQFPGTKMNKYIPKLTEWRCFDKHNGAL